MHRRRRSLSDCSSVPRCASLRFAPHGDGPGPHLPHGGDRSRSGFASLLELRAIGYAGLIILMILSDYSSGLRSRVNLPAPGTSSPGPLGDIVFAAGLPSPPTAPFFVDAVALLADSHVVGMSAPLPLAGHPDGGGSRGDGCARSCRWRASALHRWPARLAAAPSPRRLRLGGIADPWVYLFRMAGGSSALITAGREGVTGACC